MSSQIPTDPMLDEQHDDVWRRLVFQFLQLYPPAAIDADSQDALDNLVLGYIATSNDIDMQALMVVLDTRYNLVGRGLIDAGLMHVINTNVANYRAVMPQQPPPAPMQPMQPVAPSYTTTDTPAMQPTPTQPPTLRPPQAALRPPHTNRLAIHTRQKDWDHVCDLCGYRTECRSTFARHMRIGALRAGFTIVKIDPLNDPHWYGEDEAGTEYMGDVVAKPTDAKKRGRGGAIRPPPCGPRMREAERRCKEKRVARQEAAEKRYEEENDGDENEDEAEDEAEEWR